MTIHIFNALTLISASIFPFGLFILGTGGTFKKQVKGMVFLFACAWIGYGVYAFVEPRSTEFQKAIWLVSTLGWALQKECRDMIIGIVSLPFYTIVYAFLLVRDVLLIESQEDDMQGVKDHWLSWVQ